MGVPARLERGQPGPSGGNVVKPETGIVLVLLPGGVVPMGARRPDPGGPFEGPNIDPDASPQEAPIDDVRLDPFFISKFEMTEAQWVRVTGATHPSDAFPGMWSAENTTPVYAVDWYDATRVLRRIGLALPTEAQWEYAARAGTTTPWWTGARPDTLQGAEVFSTKDALPVGRFQAERIRTLRRRRQPRRVVRRHLLPVRFSEASPAPASARPSTLSNRGSIAAEPSIPQPPISAPPTGARILRRPASARSGSDRPGF